MFNRCIQQTGGPNPVPGDVPSDPTLIQHTGLKLSSAPEDLKIAGSIVSDQGWSRKVDRWHRLSNCQFRVFSDFMDLKAGSHQQMFGTKIGLIFTCDLSMRAMQTG